MDLRDHRGRLKGQKGAISLKERLAVASESAPHRPAQTNRKYIQSSDLREPGSCSKPDGIIDFYDDIRARGTIAILAIEEVVVNHQVEVTAGFREKVQSAMNAQVL